MIEFDSMNKNTPIKDSGVKDVRLYLGVDQAEFDRMLGLTRGMVWKYEKGLASPSPKIFNKILKLCVARGGKCQLIPSESSLKLKMISKIFSSLDEDD